MKRFLISAIPVVVAFFYGVNSQAALIDCPLAGTIQTCSVSVGNSTLTVVAEEEELIGLSWQAGGQQQLTVQDFRIFERNTGVETEDTLRVAQFDAAAGQIVVEYQQDGIFNGAGIFVLTDDGTTATVDQNIVITSLASETLETRFFSYTDYDLNGDTDDDAAFDTGGTKLTQSDGGTVATSEILSGPAPDAFQIAFFPTLFDELILPVSTLTLDNSTAGPGVGNYEHAFSWDVDLAPAGTFEIDIRGTVTPVPIPAASWLMLSGLLAAFAGMRRRQPA
jgi:hypothetical protein